MAEFFEVGDFVVLNSGGPIMTIIIVDSEDSPIGAPSLVCTWTRSDGESTRDRFDRRTVSLLVRENV